MPELKNVQIVCSSADAQDWFSRQVEFEGLCFVREPSKAENWLLVDYPSVSMMQFFGSVPLERTLFISSNPCPEYLENIWDTLLGGFLIYPFSRQQLETALDTLSNGERYRNFNTTESLLTPTQRRWLPLILEHLDAHTEAERMNTTPARVRCMWSEIYERLGLKGHSQLFAYYTGMWHTLKGTPYFERWLERGNKKTEIRRIRNVGSVTH